MNPETTESRISPESQRIAIAEACGWYIHDPACPTGVTMWRHPKHPYGWRDANGLPDYLNDLNAMHEAEKVLVGRTGFGLWRDGSHQFWGELISVTTCDQFHLVHATAIQRAEAFLRCIGKWSPEPPSPINQRLSPSTNGGESK